MRPFSFLLLIIFSAIGAQAQPADTAYLSPVKEALRAVWPNNRTVNIVFHGHSVPAGYGDRHEVNSLEAYPNLVFERLKKKYIYAPVSVIVTAIGGENAIKGQQRFGEDVLQKKPDVVLLDYSLNDRGAGLEKSREAWEKMIEAALQKNIRVILLTPSPDQRVDITVAGNELEQHAEQVRALAKKYHVALVDSFAIFQQLARENIKLSEYMASVNHPNKKGHDLIASEIMKWF